MSKSGFDPEAYIASAFLDTNPDGAPRMPSLDKETEEAPVGHTGNQNGVGPGNKNGRRLKFRKTLMSAPRPRRITEPEPTQPLDTDLQEVWQSMPRNVSFLMGFFDDTVTANYYGGEFKETREELIRRLLDPELSLEETSRLLGVCPATIRRYTNRGWLAHHRTSGGQRRFRLSNVVRFVEVHGRFPEE